MAAEALSPEGGRQIRIPAEDSSARGNKRQKLVSSAALHGGDATNSDSLYGGYPPHSDSLYGGDATNSYNLCGGNSTDSDNLWLDEWYEPERPLPFPEGTFDGFVPLVDPNRTHQWPKSLMRLFKAGRFADSAIESLLNNMPPKLRSTVVQIFSSTDMLLSASASQGPTAPDPLPEKRTWQNSMRCGLQMQRMDMNSIGNMTGVDVNHFWTDLAGLHKEEFVNRAFNGDMGFMNSELRQTAKMVIFGFKELLKLKLAAVEGKQHTVPTRPLYSRFTKNWGRGGSNEEGVMTRVTVSTVPEGPYTMVYQNLVVVSPEEYDAVRAQHPELCEGYLAPVVGYKSAQELMDPGIIVRESFAHMSSHPEGRAQLDKFADIMADEFSFLFDFFERHNIAPPPRL